MKKVRAQIIYSAFICLWPLSCLAVKDANQRLFDAIHSCDPNEVKQAIVDGADVNFKYGEHIGTPLDNAIDYAESAIRESLPERYVTLKMVMLLIKNGADVNGQGTFGWTPLMNALSLEQPSLVVELLLSYGADPERKSAEGETALSVCSEEMLELFESYPTLLQKVKMQPSRALLRECIEKGRFTLVKLLLQRDVAATEADYVLAQNKYNQTHSMAYEIIGKMLKEQLSTTTKLGLIAKHGIIRANTVLHSGEYLEFTHNIAEHIGSFLPFV